MMNFNGSKLLNRMLDNHNTSKALWVTCSLLIALFTTPTFASKTINERVDFSRGLPEESVEDMSVKVLGGAISVGRYYRIMRQRRGTTDYPGISGAFPENYVGSSLRASAANEDFLDERSANLPEQQRDQIGVWQFHRKWHDIIFLNEDANGDFRIGTRDRFEPTLEQKLAAIEYIDRNDYIYERVENTNYFLYEHNGDDLRITLTDTGFLWTNREGDWVAYDFQGKAIVSGDKNSNTITVERDADGFITEYIDRLGQTLVTWEYENRKPVSATDYTGRKVEYVWNGHDLIEVITTRGHSWIYTYREVGDDRVMSSKTDPEDQTFTYNFIVSAGGFITAASSGSSRPDIDIVGDQGPTGIVRGSSGSGGSSTTVRGGGGRSSTIAVAPTLLLRSKTYPDGQLIQYQYFFDFQTDS